MNDREKKVKDLLRRFEAFRKETGRSYENVAQEIGVSMFTLMRWSQGTVKTPAPLTLKAVEECVIKYEQGKHNG